MTLYTEVLQSAQQLTVEEQAQLLRELAAALRQQRAPTEHRITELKGLGQGIWADVDAQEYVRQERASWDDEEPGAR